MVAVGYGIGMGAGAVLVVVVLLELLDVDIVVDAVVAAARFVSERVEYIAAVIPAPVAALTAAMMAIVDLDILKAERFARSVTFVKR